jgi:hypothetical protein
MEFNDRLNRPVEGGWWKREMGFILGGTPRGDRDGEEAGSEGDLDQRDRSHGDKDDAQPADED